MLTVISPAKTLDFESSPKTEKFTSPDFLKQSRQLVDNLKKESPKNLSKLMGISAKLGELNAQRYKDWQTPFNLDNSKQAILAFKGDVYLGLDAENYDQRDLNFAQKHLRILSGLYGVLRPLDLIQPYRLEMGTRLPISKNKNLYEFWGDRLSRSIQDDLEKQRNKTLINLASNEYFKPLKSPALKSPVINPVFKDYSKGAYKVMSFFAKKARGLMASYIVTNRINQPQHLKEFDLDGYRFSSQYSSDDTWVFTRKGN